MGWISRISLSLWTLALGSCNLHNECWFSTPALCVYFLHICGTSVGCIAATGRLGEQSPLHYKVETGDAPWVRALGDPVRTQRRALSCVLYVAEFIGFIHQRSTYRLSEMLASVLNSNNDVRKVGLESCDEIAQNPGIIRVLSIGMTAH